MNETISEGIFTQTQLKALKVVSEAEVAYLVLTYLKDNKFKKTYEIFQPESLHLTEKLVEKYKNNQINRIKKKPKSLWTILSEYLSLKEEIEERKKFISQFNTPIHYKPTEEPKKLSEKMYSTLNNLSELLEDYHSFRSSFTHSSPSKSPPTSQNNSENPNSLKINSREPSIATASPALPKSTENNSFQLPTPIDISVSPSEKHPASELNS